MYRANSRPSQQVLKRNLDSVLNQQKYHAQSPFSPFSILLYILLEITFGSPVCACNYESLGGNQINQAISDFFLCQVVPVGSCDFHRALRGILSSKSESNLRQLPRPGWLGFWLDLFLWTKMQELWLSHGMTLVSAFLKSGCSAITCLGSVMTTRMRLSL